MAQKGRLDDAVTHLLEAVRLKPDYEQAKRNLSIVLGTQGKRGRD
jgi:Flp pilus assembly protein TadD